MSIILSLARETGRIAPSGIKVRDKKIAYLKHRRISSINYVLLNTYHNRESGKLIH